MLIHDPLYGSFEVPEYLHQLLSTPEVRRLSQIRLLNTLSPTLATLGEVRRYSHTLGVLHLALITAANSLDRQETRAMAAAVLLHDIGTPPFGHLMEYHLKEAFGWSHEAVIRDVLWGFHYPSNRAHQFFAGRTPLFQKELRNSTISLELVEAIISGTHPLSKLLFGTLDLDNLDNVARMTWCLGLNQGHTVAEKLASHLRVSPEGRIILSRSECIDLVQDWAWLRRRAYDTLVFDAPTVAAQAVLSKTIKIALDEAALDRHDWALSDEGLIDLLLSNPSTKRSISHEYLGKLPECSFIVQFSGSPSSLNFSTRQDIGLCIEDCLRQTGHGDNVLGYVFIDRGVFEKRVTFTSETGSEWSVGSTSHSVVCYGFYRSSKTVSNDRSGKAVEMLVSKLGVAGSSIVRSIIGVAGTEDNGQQSFDFPTE